MIDRIFSILKENGISRIVIVIGYKNELYEEYFKNSKNVILVNSDIYKWIGIMYLLFLVKDYIDDDFLFIENDLIFEGRVIKELVESENRDCILFINESGFGDEVFVEIRDNYLFKMFKDIY